MSDRPGLEVDCAIQHLDAVGPDLVLELDLVDGERVIARESLPASSAASQPSGSARRKSPARSGSRQSIPAEGAEYTDRDSPAPAETV